MTSNILTVIVAVAAFSGKVYNILIVSLYWTVKLNRSEVISAGNLPVISRYFL